MLISKVFSLCYEVSLLKAVTIIHFYYIISMIIRIIKLMLAHTKMTLKNVCQIFCGKQEARNTKILQVNFPRSDFQAICWFHSASDWQRCRKMWENMIRKSPFKSTLLVCWLSFLYPKALASTVSWWKNIKLIFTIMIQGTEE